MKKSEVQHYNSVTKTRKCAGEKLLASRSRKMTISSLRCWRFCVTNRAGLVQVRNVSAQALKVDRQQQQQQNKYEEEFHNYLYLKSSLHEVYKIDLDARLEFYLQQ